MTIYNDSYLALNSGNADFLGAASYLGRLQAYRSYFDATKTGRLIGDVDYIFQVQAGMLVLGVLMEIQTGQASVTVDVGDNETADGWLDGASCATAGFQTSLCSYAPFTYGSGTLIPAVADTVYAVPGGKLYTTGASYPDYIQALWAGANPATLQAHFWVVLWDFRRSN